ncbi:UNVERIFIED_CONTAM: hypothetical protein NCL1_33741 [Trichonephila clavipes]
MYSVSRFYKKAISGLGVRLGKSSRLFIGNVGSPSGRRATPSDGGFAEVDTHCQELFYDKTVLITLLSHEIISTIS